MLTVANERTIIIGIDPHPGHHTGAALDNNGLVLGTMEVLNTPEGLMDLLCWSEGYEERLWAIEGAGNQFVSELVTLLRDRDEVVVDVPALLTSQYRARRTRHKSDEIDAVCAARGYLANPELPVFLRGERQEALQELSRTHRRLSRALKSQRMALRAASLPEVREALEGAIIALKRSVAHLEGALRERVKRDTPELLGVRGVGPVLGGLLLAECGDVRRFRSRDAFASFAGCAPVTRQSGGWVRVRVNAGGNRRLNWAFHLMVRTRLGSCSRTRAYMERKLLEGKSKREGYRCLKTIVAREIYGVLRRLGA